MSMCSDLYDGKAHFAQVCMRCGFRLSSRRWGLGRKTTACSVCDLAGVGLESYLWDGVRGFVEAQEGGALPTCKVHCLSAIAQPIKKLHAHKQRIETWLLVSSIASRMCGQLHWVGSHDDRWAAGKERKGKENKEKVACTDAWLSLIVAHLPSTLLPPCDTAHCTENIDVPACYRYHA